LKQLKLFLQRRFHAPDFESLQDNFVPYCLEREQEIPRQKISGICQIFGAKKITGQIIC